MKHEKIFKKLAKYVRDDRLDRVKSYIRKYGLKDFNYRNRKNQSLLHLACKYGSKYVLQYLLRKGFDASSQDRKGNLPIHIAAKNLLLHSDHHITSYVDIIEPLLNAYPEGRKVTNKYGVRPKDLLKLLRKQRQVTRESFPTSPTPLERDGKFHRRNDEDVSWWEKLSDEMFSECHEFQFPFGEYESQQETYGEWTSRIASEHAEKRAKYSNSYAKPKRRQAPQSRAALEEDIRLEEENRRQHAEEIQRHHLLKKKMRYESLCTTLFNSKSDSQVTVQCLPWDLDVASDHVCKVLLAGIAPSDITTKKRYLREQQIRWHPDKFQQIWSSRVAEEDREKISAIVNHLSQIINGCIENM